MMKSTEYVIYTEVLHSFVDKMSGNALLFKSKEQYVEWIDLNLLKTTFLSKVEFITMIDEMLSTHTTLETKNFQLYEYLNSSDQNLFLKIVNPSLATMPTITVCNTCTNACISDHLDGESGNNSAYSLNYETNNPALAEAYYWTRVKELTDSLSGCIYDC